MINDKYLEQCARAFNGESFSKPTHLLVSTNDITLSSTLATTAITGEIGTRGALTSDRDDNVVTFNFLRSGVNVINTATGDDIKTIMLLTAVTGGDIMTGLNVGGLLQTTNFDIDIDWQIRWTRN
jgi:hypothetical protein